jgi:hypothetical protein
MTPQDLHKLQGYLRTVLGARLLTIKARPKKKDQADVYVGDKVVGMIEVDDEDDELTYQVEIHVPEKPIPLTPAEMKRLEGALCSVLDGKGLTLKPRLSPKNMKPLTDSCEVFAGSETLGTLSADKGEYVFQFPVFDMDLEDFNE